MSLLIAGFGLVVIASVNKYRYNKMITNSFSKLDYLETTVTSPRDVFEVKMQRYNMNSADSYCEVQHYNSIIENLYNKCINKPY